MAERLRVPNFVSSASAVGLKLSKQFHLSLLYYGRITRAGKIMILGLESGFAKPIFLVD